MTEKCPYANLFGKPGEGIHKYRLGPFALVDILLTVLGALIASYIIPGFNFITSFICLLLLAIILHKIFCVDTALNKMIFK
jgi:hypothetical protein